MKSERSGRAKPWLALAVTALVWTLSSGSAELQSSCALTQDALASFELWRLWTGHLVHFGAAHLRGDLIAFLVWAVLLETESRAVLWRVLLGVAPLLSLAILASCPSLAEYRGLSGLDCSLVVALILLRGVANARLRGLGWLCLICFGAKCGYELLSGHALLAPDLGDGVALLPSAHLLGAVGGLLATRKTPRPGEPRPGRLVAGSARCGPRAQSRGTTQIASLSPLPANNAPPCALHCSASRRIRSFSSSQFR